MSASSQGKLFLYDVKTKERVAAVETHGLDVVFPPEIHGWSDVLDCRPAPYPSKTLEENCEFAYGVHKKVILVSAAQLSEAG